MDYLYNFIISAFVGSGSALLIVHFLGKRLIEHRLSKDLERYKTELSEKTDVLKTQLGIFAHEQNVAISRVDAQRAEAIHNVYACIRDIINPISKISAGVPIVGGTPEQTIEFYFKNAQMAHTACGALANTMADLAIYFDNETYKEISSLAKSSMDAAAIYLQPLRKNIAEGAEASVLVEIAENGRSKLKIAFEQEITKKAKQLTAAFRCQLGITKPHADD
jgi:hypothetical protein